MKTEEIVQEWFDKWESGNFMDLPLTDDFQHSSPFGTIEGKSTYLQLVQDNKDKFLGNRFILQDTFYEQEKACVRYKAVQVDFELEISEWFYLKGELIDKIVSYYHIGEIREERKLSDSKT